MPTTEDNTEEMEYGIGVELSERELLSIGKIVALWELLEYQIFCQTLQCFDTPNAPFPDLPKEMNNIQFSGVLALWKSLVVDVADSERNKVLKQQYKAILYYMNFRNALIHGMWDWSLAAPEQITSIRIRKKDIIKTHFTADDLACFAETLETINYKIRYPGGKEDFINEWIKEGSSMTRLWWCLMTSNPLTKDLLPSSMRGVLPDDEPKQS
jgi:hypothetical protein